VFLDERGLCRIHARFGEAAKPLACRVYPYAMHPAGRKTAVSLRFSCPSVVANRGRPVTQQAAELRQIASWIVPPGADRLPPPAVTGRQILDWSDFHRFVGALDVTLSEGSATLPVRLLRAVAWVRLVEQSQFDALRGPRLGEYLTLVTEAAQADVEQAMSSRGESHPDEPSRAGRLHFRLLAAHYARRDTLADRGAGWRGRARLLAAWLRFARGRGDLIPLQADFRAVPFKRLESPFGVPPEAEKILTRYFRVKVQGLHFCGPAFYGVSFVEGWYSLALMFPLVLWLARWLAVGEGRDRLTADDVARALAVADHHHGYSPVLGGSSIRSRVRSLARHQDLDRLIAWYAG
jgi:lysine-N-methylase